MGYTAVTVEMADKYFTEQSLSGTEWLSYSETERNLALSASSTEICSVLFTPYIQVSEEQFLLTAKFDLEQMAVFEWAFFILKYNDKIETMVFDSGNNLLEKEVEGLGREKYSDKKGQTSLRTRLIYSSKAGLFIEAIRRKRRIMR